MTAHPGNLAGRPPMGLKDRDAVKTPRQRKRLRSKRKKATAMESGHMGAVAGLPCLVCGCWPVEVHHEGKPRNNSRVLPLSALTGAIFLVAADTVARIVMAPEDMPIGVVTGLVGGVFFLLLMARRP